MPRNEHVPDRGTVTALTIAVLTVSHGEHRGSREWLLLSFVLAVLMWLSGCLFVSKDEKKWRGEQRRGEDRTGQDRTGH